MKVIPEERYICKWCVNCEIFEDSDKKEDAICNVDIRELVNVNTPSCCDFEYDDAFNRS